MGESPIEPRLGFKALGSVELNGKTYTVVGVVPKGFDVPTPWTWMGEEKLHLAFPDDYVRRRRGYSLPIRAT